jgi:hypothetical protein
MRRLDSTSGLQLKYKTKTFHSNELNWIYIFSNRYFRLINAGTEKSLEDLRVASVLGKNHAEVVVEQLKVLLGRGMAKEFRQWFGFYKKDKKAGDEEAEYRPTEQKMYADWELSRLSEMGTSAFKEILLGCRIDADCDGHSPAIKPWIKGGEPPPGLDKKRERPVVPLLKREDGSEGGEASSIVQLVEEKGDDEAEDRGQAVYPRSG